MDGSAPSLPDVHAWESSGSDAASPKVSVFTVNLFAALYTHTPQDEITIDILRGLQGIGPAAAIPAALGILAHTFPPSHFRSIAFATFAAGAPVGGAVGNIIGGVFTQVTK